MTLRAAFVDFDPSWIVHEDGALVVVDKPPFVSTQAAREGVRDDLVSRLQDYLSRRDGAKIALGVHQRLDKETSGLVLYVKDPKANKAVAAAFEGRSVEKTYVAAVTGYPGGARTLRDVLAKDSGGGARVVSPKDPRGKPAVSHVALAKKKGARALVTVLLETGRTHQARVQLAHAGFPIVGDPLYGGAPSPRLLLHAQALALPHPMTGERLLLTSRLPDAFEAWLDAVPAQTVYRRTETIRQALLAAAERRYPMVAGEDTTAFRLVNEEADGLPKLAVDVYGEYVVAQLYDADGLFADPAVCERLYDALFALGARGVYLKKRPKQANELVDTRREDLAPRAPVRGEAAPGPIVVHESAPAGATPQPFVVKLDDGLSTGVFLEQRRNRRLVRELSAGKSVLNLFAYTGGFSVAAALGGATRTVTVDASLPALERARQNFGEAGIARSPEHRFVAEDAFRFLAKQKKESTRFDVCVLDPPSYSTTKQRRFVASSDYGELAADAFAVLASGGTLVACCNHRGTSLGKLRKMVQAGARLAGREIEQMKDVAPPFDYPHEPGTESPYKTVFVRIS